MTNVQVTGILVAAAYTAVVIVGLKTGEIIMPPVFSIKWEDDSESYWIAVAFDALVALYGLSFGVR